MFSFLRKSSVILLLVFHFSFAQVENENEVEYDTFATKMKMTSKHAAIEVAYKNGKIILNSTKNDGSKMQMEFHTSDPLLEDTSLGINMTQCAQYSICIGNGNRTHTVIQAVPNREFVTVSRFLETEEGKLTDCFSLEDNAQWVGGPQYRYQHWPIQNMYFDEEIYLPTHQRNMAIAERYWLSSKGFSIKVFDWVPLFVDQNNYHDKYLCFIAESKSPYATSNNTLAMSYEISWHLNSKLAHQAIVSRHFGSPSKHPDVRMIQHPIWSTWARYKVNVNERVVYNFANEILAYKFKNSQLEIDDNWETCYGSATFDPAKFPNVTRLTENLKKMGFRVTLWIHPFINVGCEPAYSTALKNGYFVKNVAGVVKTEWWQGAGGAIDFTNTKAVDWWVGRLKALEKLGIDSFKFDAGEVSFLPQPPAVNGPIELVPGIFTKAYVNALANNFNSMIEARVGWSTQYLPIFIRMIDKDTKWTWNNGLPTLITTLLQMNLAGYNWVLPDMIGGNGYLNGFLNGTFYPDKELFIRWLQTNTFMPALQYSFTPWDYDQQTIDICKKFTDLHAKITPTILKWMNNTINNGTPLNPPIWWVDPDDQQAYKINDEYLLGEEILVAPVITEDSTARDIYLPKGVWRDANYNRTYNGPTWLRDYPAPLDVLPYFIKTA